ADWTLLSVTNTLSLLYHSLYLSLSLSLSLSVPSLLFDVFILTDFSNISHLDLCTSQSSPVTFHHIHIATCFIAPGMNKSMIACFIVDRNLLPHGDSLICQLSWRPPDAYHTASHTHTHTHTERETKGMWTHTYRTHRVLLHPNDPPRQQ